MWSALTHTLLPVYNSLNSSPQGVELQKDSLDALTEHDQGIEAVWSSLLLDFSQLCILLHNKMFNDMWYITHCMQVSEYNVLTVTVTQPSIQLSASSPPPPAPPHTP